MFRLSTMQRIHFHYTKVNWTVDVTHLDKHIPGEIYWIITHCLIFYSFIVHHKLIAISVNAQNVFLL